MSWLSQLTGININLTPNNKIPTPPTISASSQFDGISVPPAQSVNVVPNYANSVYYSLGNTPAAHMMIQNELPSWFTQSNTVSNANTNFTDSLSLLEAQGNSIANAQNAQYQQQYYNQELANYNRNQAQNNTGSSLFGSLLSGSGVGGDGGLFQGLSSFFSGLFGGAGTTSANPGYTPGIAATPSNYQPLSGDYLYGYQIPGINGQSSYPLVGNSTGGTISDQLPVLSYA